MLNEYQMAIDLFCKTYNIKIRDCDDDEKEVIVPIFDTVYAIKFCAKNAQETVEFIEQIDCEFSRLFPDAPDAHLGEMMNVATNMSGILQLMEYEKVIGSSEYIAYHKMMNRKKRKIRRQKTLEYLFPHIFAR